MPVYLYMRGKDYNNHFMTVRNSAEMVKPIVDQLDWMEVHRVATRQKKTLTTKSSIEKKRQANFEDTGFCSSVCVTREGTLDGIAEPRIEPVTTQIAEVVKGYVVLSKFLSKTRFKWSTGRQLYKDPEVPDRQQRFAGRIHRDNVLECMRLSVTDLQSKCACHRDEHNSVNPAFSAVIGMSVVRVVKGKEVRIAINAQARKSIDDCLSRSQLYRPMMTMVLEEYSKMPDSWKVVSKKLLLGGVGAGMQGFRCVKNLCNMDPMSYYQPFLHYSLLLVNHYGLSFPETVGLMSAIEVVPNTSYFFSLAAEALLATHPKALHGCHRGFAFGYLVARLVLHFWRIRSEKCPGVRFNIYWEPEMPTGAEWEARCTLKTLACLRFHAAFHSLVDKKKRATQYKKLRKHFCSTTANADLLITNHVLCICSCIGLLPAWVRGEIEVSSSSRYMKWFLEKFHLPSNAETLEQITENLRHALTRRFGIPFTRRIIENVLCKVYRNRIESTSDQRFCDLAFWGQMIFTCEGDGLRISLPSKSNREADDTLVEDFLVKKWSFGNTILSVEDINGKLGMSEKGVPTPKEASNWSVPYALIFGRAQTKVGFDLNHKVEMTCTGFLLHNLQNISKELRY